LRKAVGPSGINPGFPGLSQCRGWITHVLLTRSPLSAVPKDCFSLALHVLSAPPAFVLSQDQTLREEVIAGTCFCSGRSRSVSTADSLFTLILVLKGRARRHARDSP